MDYYKILEIDKNSTNEEIKKAYRKLIIKWHPDKNSNNKEEAEQKFRNISEAYNVLRDKNKRQIYDTFGVSSFRTNTQNYKYTNNKSTFENNFFKNTKKEQCEYKLKCTLEELYTGCKKKYRNDNIKNMFSINIFFWNGRL